MARCIRRARHSINGKDLRWLIVKAIEARKHIAHILLRLPYRPAIEHAALLGIILPEKLWTAR